MKYVSRENKKRFLGIVVATKTWTDAVSNVEQSRWRKAEIKSNYLHKRGRLKLCGSSHTFYRRFASVE